MSRDKRVEISYNNRNKVRELSLNFMSISCLWNFSILCDWKYQKNSGFWIFKVGIERDQWNKMCEWHPLEKINSQDRQYFFSSDKTE